jgi:ABC-type multidrug transport system fused ATPase/permease subunit
MTDWYYCKSFLLNIHSNTLYIVVWYSSLSVYPNCWSTGFPYGLWIKTTGRNPPRKPSAGRWVLTTANAAGSKGLTCLPKVSALNTRWWCKCEYGSISRCSVHVTFAKTVRYSQQRVRRFTTVTFLQLIFNLTRFTLKYWFEWVTVKANLISFWRTYAKIKMNTLQNMHFAKLTYFKDRPKSLPMHKNAIFKPFV